MPDDSWVAELCAVPVTHVRGNESVWTLLQPFRAHLSDPAAFQAAVRGHLRAHPDLVDVWELYSLDQRSDRGYCLLTEPNGWEVFYYHRGDRLDVRHYADGFEACADFIYRHATLVLTDSRPTPTDP